MHLKLNLQMFAEGDVNDTGAETGAEEQSLSGYEQFEQLYNNPEKDGSEGEGDTVNNDPDDSLGGDDDSADGEIEQDLQEQQPWKNQYNAQQAAQRRKHEEAQRVQRERDAVFAQIYHGQINPYTNKPIQSEKDYQQYVQQYTQDQLQQAGVDQSVVQQAVNADPRVQQAAAIIQQQQAMAAQQAQQAQTQQFHVALQAIQQFDPAVKSFEDIINNPHFAEIEQRWQKGYSLEDAYYLANRSELSQKKQAAAKQQVINQAAGKKHLKPTGNNGSGDDVQVPADVMAMYREMNPKATEAEIRKNYAKFMKG